MHSRKRRPMTPGEILKEHYLAQEITSYGVDLGLGFSLAKLLERLNEIEGLAWIRVLYNYPRGVTDDLLDAFRDLPKVAEYIDMPLQHISSTVLTAMRRGIDEEGTRALVRRIRERVPGCALRTTMLVGFPGETEDDSRAERCPRARRFRTPSWTTAGDSRASSPSSARAPT